MALDRDQRREARVAIAMLPAGAVLAVGSLLAAAVLLIWAAAGVLLGDEWRLVGWRLVGAAVGLRNGVKGIEVMSAFDWRPMPLAIILWIAVIAAHPGWW